MASDLPERPQPLPTAPPRSALLEVYVELLAIARERLAVAVRIERERGFIFPETTVISRDVRTLAEKVYGPATASTGPSTAASSGPEAAESDTARTREAATVTPGDEGDGAAEVEALLRELGDMGGEL